MIMQLLYGLGLVQVYMIGIVVIAIGIGKIAKRLSKYD